jgi:preprotein translocase subunit SecD
MIKFNPKITGDLNVNSFLRLCIMIFVVSFCSVVVADNATPPVVFQVIENQLILDSESIESATVEPGGLFLKLKPKAAHDFHQLTQKNIGKRMNLVINGVLISSPMIQSALGGEFLITGISHEQALQFIRNLS